MVVFVDFDPVGVNFALFTKEIRTFWIQGLGIKEMKKIIRAESWKKSWSVPGFFSSGFLLVAVCSSALFAGSSEAASVYDGTKVDMYLKQNTFPSGLIEEKVYLDAGLSSSITGHVGSQTDSRLVTFSSTTDVLDAANGFATIKAQDGYLNNITITAPGYWFEDLIFSVNLTPNSTSDLSVAATVYSGATNTFSNWATQSNWVNGENRILVLADGWDLMQSVTITSLFGMQSIGGIDQLKQTEISGFTNEVPVPPVGSEIPIPAAAWLFGSALLGFIGYTRRRSTAA